MLNFPTEKPTPRPMINSEIGSLKLIKIKHPQEGLNADRNRPLNKRLLCELRPSRRDAANKTVPGAFKSSRAALFSTLDAALIGFFAHCLMNVFLGSQWTRRIGAVSGKELAMTLKLLHEISKRTLPLTVTDLEEIDKLTVLRAAGHLAVLLPSCNAKTPFARVLAITRKGRDALSGRDEPDG